MATSRARAHPRVGRLTIHLIPEWFQGQGTPSGRQVDDNSIVSAGLVPFPGVRHLWGRKARSKIRKKGGLYKLANT